MKSYGAYLHKSQFVRVYGSINRGDIMNKVVSNAIENIGIRLFETVNRKQSNPQVFRPCAELDPYRIQSMYSSVQVFNRCETSDTPLLVNSKHYSQYEPTPIFQDLYNQFQENQNIYFEEITDPNSHQEQTTCLIYLHGFSERNYDKEIKFLFSKLISKLPTVDILAVHQPYHMKRSPKGQPYSGAYIFDSCPIVTIEAVRQAVHDVSQLISFAKGKYENVIVGGFSLGGHIASFLGTCDDRADLYVMGQAGAKFPETLNYLTVCPGLASKRKEWIAQGIDFESLYKPIELLNYNSIIPSEKAVSLGGTYDKLITFDRVQQLRNIFKNCHEINYDSGHIGLMLKMEEIMKKMTDIINKEVIRGDKDV
jgi:hypothetical protein